MASLQLDDTKREKKTQPVDSDINYLCLQANDNTRFVMLEYVLPLGMSPFG